MAFRVYVGPKTRADGTRVAQHNPTVSGFVLENGRVYDEFVRAKRKGAEAATTIDKERHPANEKTIEMIRKAHAEWCEKYPKLAYTLDFYEAADEEATRQRESDAALRKKIVETESANADLVEQVSAEREARVAAEKRLESLQERFAELDRAKAPAKK